MRRGLNGLCQCLVEPDGLFLKLDPSASFAVDVTDISEA